MLQNLFGDTSNLYPVLKWWPDIGNCQDEKGFYPMVGRKTSKSVRQFYGMNSKKKYTVHSLSMNYQWKFLALKYTFFKFSIWAYDIELFNCWSVLPLVAKRKLDSIISFDCLRKVLRNLLLYEWCKRKSIKLIKKMIQMGK